jgi:hypothetical protein
VEGAADHRRGRWSWPRRVRFLSGFSTVGSKFVSIVRQAGMVNTGDNGI